MQVIPRGFRPHTNTLFGLGLWGLPALGGLFWMIGDPSIEWAQVQLGLKKVEEEEK
jgi:hypothetical protein